MSIAYYKRFKMEIELANAPPVPALPLGYSWLPWDESFLDLHADVQYRAFCEELDSALFPSFGDRAGCMQLLREVRRKPGFLPGATWLIVADGGCCGTVQGVVERNGFGAIQNVGVVPSHRGRSLGSALIVQSLHGFRRYGLRRALLEVTAKNEGAIRLYQRLGFRRMKTLYKAVELEHQTEVVW